MENSVKKNQRNDPDSRLPLPQDAPLLAFSDVAAYLRKTTAAVRRMVDGRMGETTPDEIGTLLRQWVVRLSPHRRYIRRQPFLEWLNRTTQP
jgi:hypothetical protein